MAGDAGAIYDVFSKRMVAIGLLVDAIRYCYEYQEPLNGECNSVTEWIGPRLHQIMELVKQGEMVL